MGDGRSNMCGDPYWLIRELSSYLQQYGQAAGSCSAETLFSSTCNAFFLNLFVRPSIVYFTVFVFFSLYFLSYQFYNLQVLALVFGLCIY